MMSEIEIKAERRNGSGKADSGRIRRRGLVPCTVYGVSEKSASLTINKRDLDKVLSESHSLITLKVDGDSQISVIKDIQHHPLKGDVIHVDFQRVKAGQEINISVPIKFVGTPPGLKTGGVFQTIKSELDISTMPKYLPNEIEIDISKLEIGDAIHVRDLNLEHITIELDEDETICLIAMPKQVEEVAEVVAEGELEEEVSEEPEVITARSKDEDSEE
jgi:large subunit ribosomal protein L25